MFNKQGSHVIKNIPDVSDIVCTVRHNQLCKQTNKIHFRVCLFYNLAVTLHVSNDYIVHLQDFIISAAQ